LKGKAFKSRLSLALARGLARLLLVLAGLSAALPWVAAAHAQEAGPAVVITSVDSRAFPSVTAYLTVSGANGLPVVGLTADNFRLREDNRSVSSRTVQVESDTSQQINLVLAIDVSVRDADLVETQQAAIDFVNSLGPNDQVALLTFYEEIAEVLAFTNDKASLVSAVQAITPGGNTTLFNAALERSVSLLSALPTGRKAVVVFTNSGDTQNTLSPEPILAAAEEAQVRIFPMAFGPNVNGEVMKDWARFSGGQAYLLAGADEIRANLLTLGVLLRQSYAISFQSALAADDRPHTLTIAVDYQGQSAEAEATFTGVPGEVVVEGPGLTNGQTVRGRVFLVADVSAPAEVERVSFLLDGESLADLTRPPYRFDWDSTTAEPGTHTLTVQAEDSAGNTGQAQVIVNVVLPPPVIITATPVPTAVVPAGPSPVQVFAQNTLRVAGQVLVAAAILAGLVVATVLWARSLRSQRDVQVKTCQVEINNSGNARSRYELRAEDPTGALKFQFALHDASLVQRAGEPAAAGAPARPAAATVAEAAGPAPDGRGRRNAKETLNAGIEKGQRGLSVVENLSVWLMNLSYLMPGAAGRNIRARVSQSRTVQYDVHEGFEMPGRVDRMVKAATPGTVQGLSHGPAPANVAAARAGGGAAVASVPSTGLAAAGQGAPTALAQAGSAHPGWSVTPYIEPGSSLTVQLLVSPARPPRTQHYAFRVLSRTAEDEAATPLIEHGSVPLRGLPWTRRAVSLALMVVVLGLLAVVVWYVLVSFRVLGA
jgi:VWFA-related protein